jgi:chromosomal replication initiator protein dnaA
METVKKIWSDALAILEIEASAISFDVWIRPLEAVDIEDDQLILNAPTEANVAAINGQLRPLICEVLHRINPLIADIELRLPSVSETRAPVAEKEEAAIEKPRKMQPGFDSSMINPRYTFDNFVVGKCNQLVVAAAKAVVMTPGTLYNPLFIYGGVGLGKTHILHAIGNAIRKNDSALKVMYISSEKFVNEFIEAIRSSGGAGGFREKYRSVDVLMIDDIQFISKKAGTQEELFHTFNDMCQANKQLIFASDRAPKEIPDIEDRLRSRFEWGLIADIQPPDLETRIAILQKKAQLEKHIVPSEVLYFMAAHIDNNIREMESMLNKVVLLSKLYDKPVTLELAQETFKDYNGPTEEAVGADDIIDTTCKYFGITREDIVGKKRDKKIVEPRQICIYLISEMLPLPLTSIGSIMGGRDHTTIMHAKNKIASAVTKDERFRSAVQDIRDMIYKK